MILHRKLKGSETQRKGTTRRRRRRSPRKLSKGALRLKLQAAAAAAAAPAAGATPMSMATDAAVMEAMGMEDMDEELRQALVLSLQEAEPASAPGGAEVAPAPAAAHAAPAATGTTAVAGDTAAAGDDPMGASVDSRWFQDPSFVQELLRSLPGVDVNDPRIQSALQEGSGDGNEDPKDGKDVSKGDGKDDGSGDSK